MRTIQQIITYLEQQGHLSLQDRAYLRSQGFYLDESDFNSVDSGFETEGDAREEGRAVQRLYVRRRKRGRGRYLARREEQAKHLREHLTVCWEDWTPLLDSLHALARHIRPGIASEHTLALLCKTTVETIARALIENLESGRLNFRDLWRALDVAACGRLPDRLQKSAAGRAYRMAIENPLQAKHGVLAWICRYPDIQKTVLLAGAQAQTLRAVAVVYRERYDLLSREMERGWQAEAFWPLVLLHQSRQEASGAGIGAQISVQRLHSRPGAVVLDRALAQARFLQEVPGLSDRLPVTQEWVISQGYDLTVRIWSLLTGQEIRRFENAHTRNMSPDRKWLLIGNGHEVKLLRMEDFVCERRFEGCCGVFTRDGKHILMKSWPGDTLYELTSGRPKRQFEGNTVSLSESLIITLAGDNIYLYELMSGRLLWRRKAKDGTLSAEGRRALVDYRASTVMVEAATGRRLRRFPGTNSSFAAHDRLVTTELANKTHIFEADSGRLLHVLPGTEAEFTDDGRQVLVMRGSEIHLYDLGPRRSNVLQRRMRGCWGAFLQDSRFLVIGESEGTFRLYDQRSGQIVQSFEGHSRSIGHAYFPNGITSLRLSGPARWEKPYLSDVFTE